MLALSGMVSVTACGGLLDVTDPTLIQEKDIANAIGANGRRVYALSRFYNIITALAAETALLSDERTFDLRVSSLTNLSQALDQRRDTAYVQGTGGGDRHLAQLDELFTLTSSAIYAAHEYAPDSLKGDYLAELFAVRGYLVAQMAEDLCAGFPINDVTADNRSVYSMPYTTDAALTLASTTLDSAIAVGTSSTYVDFARVVKGRVLMGLGQWAQAAAVVTSVPTDFQYLTDNSTLANALYEVNAFTNQRAAVGNNEGGHGLPFVTAQDPRVLRQFRATRFSNATDSLYIQLKYSSNHAPMVVASGIEARLIEAEAALHAGLPDSATAILNTLRGTVSGLAALATPTTLDAQVDTLYKERAFWLYITGRRLGDMRRLVRLYARDPETVFPTGNYPLGGVYGKATSIPFDLAAQARLNPHITQGCATP